MLFTFTLLTTLSSITILAKHLAILCNSDTSITPRSNMVCLHLLQFKMLTTDRTDSLLPLISLTLLLLIESAEVKIMQISTQYIPIDTRLFHDFIIFHQIMNLFFQLLNII